MGRCNLTRLVPKGGRNVQFKLADFVLDVQYSTISRLADAAAFVPHPAKKLRISTGKQKEYCQMRNEVTITDIFLRRSD